MHIYWLPFVVVMLITIGIDFFIWREMKKSHALEGVAARVHATLAVAAQALALAMMLWPQPADGSRTTMVGVLMLLLWGYFLFYVPKTVWAALYPLHKVVKSRVTPRRFVKGTAFVAALAVFASMVVGTLHTPRTYEVSRVDIVSPRLPQGFDGYRIVHISDWHLGTYNNDTTFVAACVNAINDLHPDLIVFTGDLVNTSAREIAPFGSCLRRLSAPDGVLAVLGNHDYDDYAPCTRSQWETELRQLCSSEQELGWTLLHNNAMLLRHGGDSIGVVGTENYSNSRTPDYSRLDSALLSAPQAPYTILLQHNPEMWRAQVAGSTDVNLTLSGHTHAMQMLLTIGDRRLSPARLRYREWGGLYTEGDQQLYVNIGLGMVGVPMRIGATPEITLLTLRRGAAPPTSNNR